MSNSHNNKSAAELRQWEQELSNKRDFLLEGIAELEEFIQNLIRWTDIYQNLTPESQTHLTQILRRQITHLQSTYQLSI